MNISYNWLKEYVDIEKSPEELAGILTDSGLEVEAIEKFQSIEGNLLGVVTGKVLACEKHPNAERLTLARVDTGGDKPLHIVCGAPNVAEGQKVLVATVGTTLPSADGGFHIKKARIRGQESEGMICAEDELGVGTSHDGIMVLPADTPVGIPAADFFGLEQDWVFEIGLTPNRIDAASHIGVARDVVAVLNHQTQTKKHRLKMPDIAGFSIEDTDLTIPVIIEDPDACHRYCGLTISDVKVQESPTWLKNRLKAIGQKPINNVVDVTNFVLHELGQPLHAFDVSQIAGKKVIVRKPAAGTRFLTLDKEELELTGNDLMICNEKDAMCMAGILGGIASGVTESTTHVFLESAWFSPTTIRKSSNHHGLKTEASFRFERGADPNMALFALKRAAMMIKEIAGGRLSSDVVDEYPVRTDPVNMVFRYHIADRLIGKSIPRDQIISVLEDLDFIVHQKDTDQISITVPAYRVDVTREADVVEEILRIYGYNHVELPQKLHSSIVLSPKPDKDRFRNVISDMLASQGFFEIMNNSLTRSAYYLESGFRPGQSVEIMNPISQDLNVMRQSLLFGGLEAIAYNQNRKVQDVKLFEFGNVYQKLAPDDQTSTPLKGFREQMMLALFVTGRVHQETWSVKERQTSFFDLRNAVDGILKRMGFAANRFKLTHEVGREPYAYEQTLNNQKQVVATIGLVSSAVTRRFDIRQAVFVAMINWDHMVRLTGQQTLLYKDIPRFPEVRRDLALLVDTNVSFAEIEALAYQTEKDRLVKVGLFDVYEDEKLGHGKKSYAVSFILLDKNKTLTDKEIDQVMERLTNTYKERLGASIR